MQRFDLNQIFEAIDSFDKSCDRMDKMAFVPGAQAPPPMAEQQPPMDPAMAQQGGDPAMMQQQGMDPAMMQQQGMDPAMMQQQGMDPAMAQQQGMDPAMAQQQPPAGGGGGLSPEVEGVLSELAGGVQQVAQTVESQQQQTEQMAKRMLAMEQELNEVKMEAKNRQPMPYEGSTKTVRDIAQNAIS